MAQYLYMTRTRASWAGKALQVLRGLSRPAIGKRTPYSSATPKPSRDAYASVGSSSTPSGAFPPGAFSG